MTSATSRRSVASEAGLVIWAPGSWGPPRRYSTMEAPGVSFRRLARQPGAPVYQEAHMQLTRSSALAALAASALAGSAATAITAVADHGDHGGGRGDSGLRSSLAPSVPADPTLHGVAP